MQSSPAYSGRPIIKGTWGTGTGARPGEVEASAAMARRRRSLADHLLLVLVLLAASSLSCTASRELSLDGTPLRLFVRAGEDGGLVLALDNYEQVCARCWRLEDRRRSESRKSIPRRMIANYIYIYSNYILFHYDLLAICV